MAKKQALNALPPHHERESRGSKGGIPFKRNLSQRIAVVFPYSQFGRVIIEGVADYAAKFAEAGICYFNSSSPFLASELSYWQPDLIVTHLGDKELEESMPDPKIPVVGVLRAETGRASLDFAVDDHAVGRMAAQEFLLRGFRRFAYVGIEKYSFSVRRAEGFCKELETHGHGCNCFYYPPYHGHGETAGDRSVIERHREIPRWLESLEKPVALLASNDDAALEVSQICRQRGLQVPHQIALMGTDNDDLLCRVAQPALSSVRIPLRRMGYLAAQASVDILRGNTPARRVRVFQPEGIAFRASTDMFDVDDDAVRQAMLFMQRHSEVPFKVGDVLKEVGISRSLLERKFRTALGRTPLVEIRRRRIEQAKQLLSDTGLPLKTVASRVGFSSNIRFTTVFRELTGITPSEYRWSIGAT